MALNMTQPQLLFYSPQWDGPHTSYTTAPTVTFSSNPINPLQNSPSGIISITLFCSGFVPFFSCPLHFYFFAITVCSCSLCASMRRWRAQHPQPYSSDVPGHIHPLDGTIMIFVLCYTVRTIFKSFPQINKMCSAFTAWLWYDKPWALSLCWAKVTECARLIFAVFYSWLHIRSI